MHNQKLARSLKQGCNDHIEELAIITEKLVLSEVKKSSKKREPAKGKKQRKQCKIDNVLEENVAQDETKEKEKETKSAKKKVTAVKKNVSDTKKAKENEKKTVDKKNVGGKKNVGCGSKKNPAATKKTVGKKYVGNKKKMIMILLLKKQQNKTIERMTNI